MESQSETVICDIGVNAVKTGMLFSSEIIKLVSQQLKQRPVKSIVIDPMMI
ncbi:bifunctional hydroxymethylpyrimidine kinase/phosphomethylpyrimidine kinase [Paenibacillus faecalis]|uniref:bifunctional hydroxymethylpyrimidine kinase/phosphomethylpyrimidine kinase n=1 Tax=Paenibacillus faecalis TaxID=2079532 RepID=UPI000D0F4113|nr:bifunctional hydroxymethylpyrimidine kinase/phosphomethylpyrimidine kinase [Paenibacillus faecalis]